MSLIVNKKGMPIDPMSAAASHSDNVVVSNLPPRPVTDLAMHKVVNGEWVFAFGIDAQGRITKNPNELGKKDVSDKFRTLLKESQSEGIKLWRVNSTNEYLLDFNGFKLTAGNLTFLGKSPLLANKSSALLIGLGTGTDLYRLTEERNYGHVTGVEISEYLVNEAIPECTTLNPNKTTVVNADAVSFLSTDTNTYEQVLVNVEDGMTNSRPMYTQEVLQTLKGRLVSNGQFVSMVFFKSSAAKDMYLQTLRRIYNHVYLVNPWIVAASDAPISEVDVSTEIEQDLTVITASEGDTTLFDTELAARSAAENV